MLNNIHNDSNSGRKQPCQIWKIKKTKGKNLQSLSLQPDYVITTDFGGSEGGKNKLNMYFRIISSLLDKKKIDNKLF